MKSIPLFHGFFYFLLLSFFSPSESIPHTSTKEVYKDSIPFFCTHGEKFLSPSHQNLLHNLQQKQEYLYQKALSKASGQRSSSVLNETLPVVFHVIHNNGSENISDAQIMQGLDDLNQAFANTGYYDQGTGVDIGVDFCLAQRAPDGSPTSGINRIQSVETDGSVHPQKVEDFISWDTRYYINIWVVKEICRGGNCGVAAYAYLPTSHGRPHDGIVTEATWVGASSVNSTVLAHEMGHYLGLYHTFQGGCANNDCLADGDRVCDTPPDNSTGRVPCGDSMNTCSTDANPGDPNNPFTSDQQDMISNYMDYSNFDCYSQFTAGQRDRMEFFITGERSSLLDSDACESPCLSRVDANFSPAPLQLEVGNTINFANNSVNGDAYIWRIDGSIYSTTTDISYAFNQQGFYTIELNAYSNDPLCDSSTFAVTIEVFCPVNADFILPTASADPGTTLSFTNTSTDANTYTWQINGQNSSTATNFSQTFNDPGIYAITLISSNGICTDEITKYLEIENPCSTGGAGFSKLLESQFNVIPLSGMQQSNDEFLITGSVRSSSLQGLFLAQLSPQLDLIQSFRYSIPNNNAYIYHTASDQNNFNFSIGASGPIGSGIPFIAGFDNSGQLLWSRQVNNSLGMEINNVIQTNDGNFLTTGDQSFTGPTTGYYQLAKFDQNGNNIWTKEYQNPDRDDIYNFGNSFQGANGDFFNFGVHRVDFGENGICMLRSDRDGNHLDYHIYSNDMTTMNIYNSAIQLADGGIIIGGVTRPMNTFANQMVFIKVDIDGNIIWSKRLSFASSNSLSNVISNLRPKSDGTFIAALRLAPTYRILLNIDTDGNIIWDAFYQLNGSNAYYGELLEVSDGLVYMGAMSSGVRDLHILKTNPQGEINTCTDPDLAYTYEDWSLKHLTAPFVETNRTISYTPLNFQQFPINFTERTLCQNTSASEADATIANPNNTTCNGIIEVRFELCNDGGTPMDASTPISFYPLNPTQSNTLPVLTTMLGQNVGPGDCINYTQTLSSTNFPQNSIYWVINDNGSNTPLDLSLIIQSSAAQLECNFHNNMDSTSFQNYTPPLLTLGNDTSSCFGSNYAIHANPGFVSYQWQDGFSDSVYTASTPGTYWLNVIDSCGNQQSDTIIIRGISAGPTLDLGPDRSICGNSIQTISAGGPYLSYEWQDFSTDSVFTAWRSGKYWVTVIDSCGNQQSDTLNIQLDNIQQIDLGPDQIICGNQSVQLSVDPTGIFDHYEWFPKSNLNCDTCRTVQINTNQSNIYSILASTDNGCFAMDSILIQVVPEIFNSVNVNICTGDTLWVGTTAILPNTIDTLYFVSGAGCDSLVEFRAGEVNAIQTQAQQIICEGDSISIFGQFQKQEGFYAQTFNRINQCDSTHTIELIVNKISYNRIDTNLCPLDTLWLGGFPLTANVTDTLYFINAVGCDSVLEVRAGESTIAQTQERLDICAGDSISIFGQFEQQAGFYSETFNRLNKCDSTHTVELIVNSNNFQRIDTSLCSLDTLWLGGIPFSGNISDTLYFTNAIGCDSIIDIQITESTTAQTQEQLSICEGDSISIFGQFEQQAGFYNGTFSRINQCDSIHTVELIVNTSFFESLDTTICEHDTLWINNTPILPNSVELFSFNAANGCDSTIEVITGGLSTLETSEVITICQEDSAFIFNQWQNTTGPYAMNFSSIDGCDSVHTVDLQIYTDYTLEFNVIEPNCTLGANGIVIITNPQNGWTYSLNGTDFQLEPVFENLDPDDYFIHLLDENLCESVWPFTINSTKPLSLELPSILQIELGDSIQSDPLINGLGNLTYNWTPEAGLSCSNCPNPWIKPLQSSNYILSIENDDGCIISDSLFVEVNVNKEKQLYVPNIFSPNEDGINDRFGPFASDQVSTILEFQIYNRWGALIYEVSNFPPNTRNFDWDGTFKGEKAQSGVYVYWISYELINGGKRLKEGDVLLLR